MKIVLDLKKSLEENANLYYEKSKRAKKKLEGVKKAYKISLKKLESIKETKPLKKPKNIKKKKKKKWFEKFHWFYSVEGFLCIGGRDATTNDIIIKKYTDKDDLVFHTQIPGSPFFVIKTEGKSVTKQTLQDVAQATVSYSRAWRQGLSSEEVYYVKSNQVKNELGLPKGTFMIHGKRNYITVNLELAIGVKDGQIIGGPVNTIKKQAEELIIIKLGDLKKSDVAKKIKAILGGDLDEIMSFLPNGIMQIFK